MMMLSSRKALIISGLTCISLAAQDAGATSTPTRPGSSGRRRHPTPDGSPQFEDCGDQGIKVLRSGTMGAEANTKLDHVISRAKALVQEGIKQCEDRIGQESSAFYEAGYDPNNTAREPGTNYACFHFDLGMNNPAEKALIADFAEIVLPIINHAMLNDEVYKRFFLRRVEEGKGLDSILANLASKTKKEDKRHYCEPHVDSDGEQHIRIVFDVQNAEVGGEFYPFVMAQNPIPNQGLTKHRLEKVFGFSRKEHKRFKGLYKNKDIKDFTFKVWNRKVLSEGSQRHDSSTFSFWKTKKKAANYLVPGERPLCKPKDIVIIPSSRFLEQHYCLFPQAGKSGALHMVTPVGDGKGKSETHRIRIALDAVLVRRAGYIKCTTDKCWEYRKTRYSEYVCHGCRKCGGTGYVRCRKCTDDQACDCSKIDTQSIQE